MRKKTLLYIFFAGLSVLLIAGFVLRQQFYGNAVKTERELFVSSRADYRALVDSLLPELKHHWAFGVYARRINLAETFKPGHYLLERGMSVIRVARMLKLGMQTPVRVTINNADSRPAGAETRRSDRRRLRRDHAGADFGRSRPKSGFRQPDPFFDVHSQHL